MKNTISLVLSVMFSMSLIAQTPQKNAEKFNKILKLKQERSVVHLENKREEHTFRDKKMINDYRAVTQKSAETIKQRLDSIIYKESDNLGNWVNSSKEVFTYDSKGNETSGSYYDWDMITGKWVGSEKYEATLDSKGNMTLNVRYEWDVATKKWVGTYKSESTYDVNGNITLNINYDTSSPGVFYMSYKVEYTYDLQGNLTLEISSNWDFMNNKWGVNSKIEYSYDSNGNEILGIRYYWNAATWGGSEKWESTYDANGNETVFIRYYWEASTGRWVGSYKSESTFDSNGNETLRISYTWDTSTSKWVGSYKDESVFDALGNETLYVSYVWDVYAAKWVIDYKYETTFDLNGNLILEIDYAKDEITGLLVADSRIEPAWNNSFTDLIMPEDYYDLSIFKHMLTGYDGYTWNAEASQWDLTDKATFFYSGQNITGIKENIASSVNIYPNPATDFLTFNFNDVSQPALVELFDLQGKKVLSREIFNNQKLPVSHLKSGMYICKVNQKGNLFNSKVLIK